LEAWAAGWGKRSGSRGGLLGSWLWRCHRFGAPGLAPFEWVGKEIHVLLSSMNDEIHSQKSFCDGGLIWE